MGGGPLSGQPAYKGHPADDLGEFIPGKSPVWGKDGFGGGDTRQQLREHFEVSREHIALAALKALADRGEVDIKTVEQAITQWGIDADKPNPIRA